MPVDRTMYLYHVTHKSLWLSIGVQGLLLDYSSGAKAAIWLVSESRVSWAVAHVKSRDNVPAQDLIVVSVRVRRGVLRRNRLRGVWYCVDNIYPCRVETIKPFAEWSMRSKK